VPGPTDQYDMPAQRLRADQEQRARLDARAWQRRQDAATAPPPPYISPPIGPAPSEPPYLGPYQPIDCPPSPPRSYLGVVVAVAIGIILTILCGYAIAHGVSLLTVGLVAGIGLAALTAIATLLAVLRFLNAHPLITMALVGAAIYVWVHFSH
jgi:hypothetical protein